MKVLRVVSNVLLFLGAYALMAYILRPLLHLLLTTSAARNGGSFTFHIVNGYSVASAAGAGLLTGLVMAEKQTGRWAVIFAVLLIALWWAPMIGSPALLLLFWSRLEYTFLAIVLGCGGFWLGHRLRLKIIPESVPAGGTGGDSRVDR
jgi:hypothetical protein